MNALNLLCPPKGTPRPLLLCVLLFALAALASACGGGGGGGDDDDPGNRAWSVFVYMDGDNDLTQAALRDLEEMEAVGSTEDVKVVVQVDLAGGVTTRRYIIRQGARELLKDLGELDMASPETITNFLAWAAVRFPAERTAFILWNHGNGWDQMDGPSGPVAARQAQSILHELEGDNGSPFLHNHRVRRAIEDAGAAIDLFGMDASIMGTIEALYEFRDLAPVQVSSQEVGQSDGWDYEAILSQLVGNPAMDAEELAQVIVDSYRDFFENVFYPANPGWPRQHGIAAQRTPFFESIADEIEALAGALTDGIDDPATREETLALIGAARADVQEIDRFVQPFVYVDLVDLEARLGLGTSIADLLFEATIAEYHGEARPNAHGVSIVFFRLPEGLPFTYDSDYRDYDPDTNTGNAGEFLNRFHWDEFLDVYYEAAGLL